MLPRNRPGDCLLGFGRGRTVDLGALIHDYVFPTMYFRFSHSLYKLLYPHCNTILSIHFYFSARTSRTDIALASLNLVHEAPIYDIPEVDKLARRDARLSGRSIVHHARDQWYVPVFPNT